MDHFDPEDVLVANSVDGGTKIERLEPERLRDWLKDYSLGQLWEKNEFAGRPVPESDMARLLVHVEGQTEEAFVNEVLREHLVGVGYESVQRSDRG